MTADRNSVNIRIGRVIYGMSKFKAFAKKNWPLTLSQTSPGFYVSAVHVF